MDPSLSVLIISVVYIEGSTRSYSCFKTNCARNACRKSGRCASATRPSRKSSRLSKCSRFAMFYLFSFPSLVKCFKTPALCAAGFVCVLIRHSTLSHSVSSRISKNGPLLSTWVSSFSLFATPEKILARVKGGKRLTRQCTACLM